MWRLKHMWLRQGLLVKQSFPNLKAVPKSDKKCVISDLSWPALFCPEMLDRALSSVFDGLMNSRPACQDKVRCLAEHAGADQIPIRTSLVSLAWSEPDGHVFFVISNLTSLITSIWNHNIKIQYLLLSTSSTSSCVTVEWNIRPISIFMTLHYTKYFSAFYSWL